MNSTAGHRPRKRFGQNFLHDKSVVDRLLASINPTPGDTIVEIGPGQGAVTEGLIKSGAQVTAIELDRDLASALDKRFAGSGLTLHQADALRFDFTELVSANARLRIVGNLPYNISTPLLFHLLEQKHCIGDMHFMLQREVVERLAAEPGTKSYGRLSVMAQYHCAVEPLFEVQPTSFVPAPKVMSQIVRLQPNFEQAHAELVSETLPALLRTAFSQRRKTLRKVFRGLITTDQLTALNIDPGRRPDTLSLTEFIAIASFQARGQGTQDD